MPRIHVAQLLEAGALLELPPGAARHVQVLRLQPGDELVLFNGSSQEWPARVTAMGRSTVTVRIGESRTVDRELIREVTLALGMPANERMDALVEKATELGVAAIQPLVCARSVLRLSGERAIKRQEHWQAIAIAASEQCGRTRPPRIEAVRSLTAWLDTTGMPAPAAVRRLVLSPRGTLPWGEAVAAGTDEALLVLSGPEGGLTPEEEAAAQAAGFIRVTLGPRVLRADTAPIAVLSWCALEAEARQPDGGHEDLQSFSDPGSDDLE
jgi:16S rRNA (uracil1498-N3)-methyltransferase